jgi:hypothetical protein
VLLVFGFGAFGFWDYTIIKKMRDLRIRQVGVSKYCLHLAMIDNDAKSNRFKPVLRSMKKIKQGYYE